MMPWFTLLAKDRLAVETIEFYRDRCAEAGLAEQAAEVEKALEEFRDWQREWSQQVKMPDHAHVPCAWRESEGR